MKALLLIVILGLAAAGCGLTILRRFDVLREALLERLCFAAALGLGIAAYGVWTLGLFGLLRFVPITIWWVILALCGIPGWSRWIFDFRFSILNWNTKRKASPVPIEGQVWAWLFGGAAVFCGVYAVAACFRPPTGTEWDAIAYHLANPKVFLQDGRVSILPTDHHSNFPFVLEMLFAVGLLYAGFALANLFHLLMTVVFVAAVVAWCGRVLHRNVGFAAGLLLMTTPLVLWEASVAYTDLGMALYVTLATFAVISAAESRKNKQNEDHGELREHGEIHNSDAPMLQRPDDLMTQWLLLAGLCLGFALGIKYLAILPLVILIGYAVLKRLPHKAIVKFAVVAALVGCPWYIKNAVQMNNPVYPYFAGVFKNSKYWSAERARAYEGEQKSFGFPNRLAPNDKEKQTGLPLALIQTPWRLVANSEWYANPGNFDYAETFGGVTIALCFSLMVLRGVPASVRGIAGIALIQVLAWFVNAQVGRYLLSVWALLCVVAGYAAWRLSSLSRTAYGAVSVLLLAQAGSLIYSVITLPSHLNLPALSALLSDPDAAVSVPRRRLGNFRAVEWINSNTKPTDGVVLYEDVFGFYLDRPYLWGNGEHSSFIPYKTMTTGAELTDWFLARGYRYALINLSFASQAQKPQTDGTFPRPAGNEQAYLQQWYVDAPQGMDTDNYRRLIQDAIRSGRWQPVFAQNGVIVLKMEATQP
jgi:hypothetical protein